MDREITETYGGYKDDIPEDAMDMIRKINKKKAKSMTKLETSFDTRYNHNGKNFNVYIKDNIASININNTFNIPGYTTIWKKEYNGISIDDIVRDINSVLKNDIIPMYESMVEDMKSSLIHHKGL